MHENQTDEDWEYFGKNDPYWAVVTNEKFHKDNLDQDAKEFFFQTGEEYISHVFSEIRSHLDQNFNPQRGLDFGSGVGRLVVPLAKRCEEVVGVDVSESMLNEAGRVVEERALKNISFVRGDDNLSGLTGYFDFINSYIVIQHIPTRRGEKIVQRLLELLNEGGVGALHLTYSRANSKSHANLQKSFFISFWKSVIRQSIKFVYNLGRSAMDILSDKNGKPDNLDNRSEIPVMQMNQYNLNSIFHHLQKNGIQKVHTEFTDHSGTYGVILLFQKTKSVVQN